MARSESQLWERASIPSDIESLGGCYYEAIDGRTYAPISSHTYDNQVFLKQFDRFLTFGGAAFDWGGPFLISSPRVNPLDGPVICGIRQRRS